MEERGAEHREAAVLTQPPLVVDLDRTLLRTDASTESVMVLARTDPFALPGLAWALLRGRAHAKRRLAAAALPDVATLPYREDLLEYLTEQKRGGRTLVLATDADARVAHAVARRLGLFDVVLASDGTTNLRGTAMARALIERFGARGFDYVGGSNADLPAWQAARAAIVVGAACRFAARIARTTPIERAFDDPRPRWPRYVQALRPHHWIKNALVLVPLATTSAALAPSAFLHASLAFAAFSLCASSVYLVNDLLDLGADRRHPSKRHRALASGAIPLRRALAAVPLLLAAAFTIAHALPAAFSVALVAYFALTTVYSLGLKDIAVVDVLWLAVGYALRVAAGAFAIGARPSAWLLAVCIFLFLSLALVKRYTELSRLQADTGGAARARGYDSGDKTLILVQGIASGYLSVLLLALYVHVDIPAALHARRELFWIVCVLLLAWLNVAWFAAARGRMHDDPVTFALTDPVSLALLIVMAGIALFAL